MGKYLEQSFPTEHGLINRFRPDNTDLEEICADYEEVAELLDRQPKVQQQHELGRILEELRIEIDAWITKLNNQTDNKR